MAPRIGLLWRAEWDPVVPGRPVAETCKLRDVFASVAALGADAVPVVYSDDTVAHVRAELLGLDGVLVWVNPIQNGLDRSRLDPLLLEASAAGVWVSAHPHVILKLGTKEVLYRTRDMSWSTDIDLYRTVDELEDRFPASLARSGTRVLKQHRGMGGAGVWKVELVDPGGGLVSVEHAEQAAVVERLPLEAFLRRCAAYLEGPGLLVDQPFQQRLADGMIRVYLTHDRVVGFAHQYPQAFLPPRPADAEPLPSKRFEGADAPAFQALKDRVESEWVPELRRILEVETTSLPVIWDIDFLYGPKTEAGDNTYVLCEINVSSTFAFPQQALEPVAQAALACVLRRR